MGRSNTRIFGGNRFTLGLFGLNCSGGLTMTKAPERWDPSWENNARAARLADDAGLEFILPIGRWRGYQGETDTEGTSFETLTWAAGLLAATRQICVFGTVHVAFISPLFAAKQMVTVDHIGRGRFGLNMVSGWNAPEHAMFGVPLRPQDERYAFTDEWVTILKRIWAEDEPFDFKGKYFDLSGVMLKPKPWGGERPVLVSAGNSPAGRAFAGRHADCLFTTMLAPDKMRASASQLRSASASGTAGIFVSAHMIARPTAREAREYHRYIVHEMGDWEAAEIAAILRTKGRETPFREMADLKERLIGGVGTYPLVGSYDDVADEFLRMSDCGIDGLAFGLVNYIDDFPAVRNEILPRLERLGLRAPVEAG